MESTISPLFGRSGKKLHALRKKNPDQSLAERWKLLVRARPDFKARYGFVPMVIETGWAVVAVPDDGLAYTVGLHYRFAQKEILLFAPAIEAEAQKRLLNGVARRVLDGERFAEGQKLAFPGGAYTHLKAYEDSTFEKYPCGYLARFEQFFEDRAHAGGRTIPVLWGVLKQSARA